LDDAPAKKMAAGMRERTQAWTRTIDICCQRAASCR